jgi:hypothetical protein
VLVTKRAVLTISAAFAAAAAAPAAASADTLFTGKTQQNRPVTVRTGADGVVNLARLTWKTARCRTDNELQLVTGFRPTFDTATTEAFGDSGSYTARLRGGIRIRVTPTISGRRVVDPADPAKVSWQGTFRATAVVRRNGRVIDRCTQRSVGWTAIKRG